MKVPADVSKRQGSDIGILYWEVKSLTIRVRVWSNISIF